MAEKALSEERMKRIQIVEVVHIGDKIMLPEDMTKPEAIVAIDRAIKYDSELVQVTEIIDAFPWDGAVAFKKAMDQLFGVVFAMPIQTWFGEIKPREIVVETDAHGGRVNVPWGQFSFPGSKNKEERLSTSSAMQDGRVVFQISATVTRLHKSAVEQLAEMTRDFVTRESIYRGKAV